MNLEQAITEYQPSSEAVQLVNITRVVLLVGIAGAGKDTVKSKLLQEDDFQDIVSHTTRAPRSNNGIAEIEGIDYHFINSDEAKHMVEQSDFIEVKFVHGTVYGTSIAEVKRAYDAGKIAITDLDVQGVDEYKAISSNVIAIFLLPPDYETWLSRLKKRYASEEEFIKEFPKRKESAIKELRHALEVPYYHFIINDDLERAVRVTDEIAHQPDVFHRKDDEARLAARDLLEDIVAHS